MIWTLIRKAICSHFHFEKRLETEPVRTVFARSQVVYRGARRDTYGVFNRSQMIRVPTAGRFEIRVVNGSANPYLAFCRDHGRWVLGIAQKIDPGPMNHDNLYEVAEAAGRHIASPPLL
jgi:glutamine synthetase